MSDELTQFANPTRRSGHNRVGYAESDPANRGRWLGIVGMVRDIDIYVGHRFGLTASPSGDVGVIDRVTHITGFSQAGRLAGPRAPRPVSYYVVCIHSW